MSFEDKELGCKPNEGPRANEHVISAEGHAAQYDFFNACTL